MEKNFILTYYYDRSNVRQQNGIQTSKMAGPKEYTKECN